jgi:hypothetical protein
MANQTQVSDTTSYFDLEKGVEYIKIHGLQRSGTNYLSHLINENFQNTKTLVNLGGWKHGHYMAPWAIGREVHIVGIVKNPYAWLASVYNYWGPNKKLRIGPDLNGVSFDEFVRNRCYLEKQRDVPFLFRAENPVQHWNDMNFHWTSIRMNQKQVVMISYEILLEKPEDVMRDLGAKLGLKQKSQFVNSNETFTPAGENLKPSGKEFNADYYKKAEWKQKYTPELLQFVNEELDTDLMVHFGYDYMLPEDLEG